MRAAWVLVFAILVQNASCLEALDDAGAEEMGALLGEDDMAPAKLDEQNRQLQGAISAIEQGVPPPGMEAMMDQGEAAPGGMEGTGVPATASGALSEGIKMAMKSVKPLMDKYVSTARALTNKYSLLKKKYLVAKSQVSKCPSEEDIQLRINSAVVESQNGADAKYQAMVKKYEAKIKNMSEDSSRKIETLELARTKLNEYIRTNKEQFHVELRAAKQSAQSAVGALQTMLKKTMLEELKKRDEAIELDQKAHQKELAEKDRKEKQDKTEEKEEKQARKEKELAAERQKKANEKVHKRETAKENKIKQDASEEMKNLNKKTVMLKVTKAVDEARKAGRMARKMGHDADNNLEDARLQKAKKVTEDDIKALSKLRHHQDLATTAVNSAKEKRTKISRFEYTAKNSLSKSEKRMSMLKKKSRWEKRHVDTMKDIAARARDKAERLRAAAQVAASSAGMDAPTMPIEPHAVSPDNKIEEAHEERESARHELKKAGMPIPPGLRKGEMSQLQNQVDSADDITKIQKHDQVETAKMKTDIARNKLATATVKRQIARDALTAEGQSIPDTLKKGGLDDERAKLERAANTASVAAKRLEAEEGGSKSHKVELARKALTKAEDASTKREAAREELEQQGQDIPESLEKGGMDEVKKDAKEALDAAEAQKGATDVEDGDSDKTKQVKKAAVANEALLRAEQAGSKVRLARAFRKKARDALQKEGKEVPEELTAGAFDKTAKRAEEAIDKAKALKDKVASGNSLSEMIKSLWS